MQNRFAPPEPTRAEKEASLAIYLANMPDDRLFALDVATLARTHRISGRTAENERLLETKLSAAQAQRRRFVEAMSA